MPKNIQDIVNSNDLEVAQMGAKALQLTNALKEGIITRTEYDELVEDLVDVERIERLAKTVQRKALLNEVFNALRMFLSLKG